MARKAQRGASLRSATALCQHFDNSALAQCARAGLQALEANHKPTILGGGKVACGVALDRCRQHQEPGAYRWDYIFTLRGGGPGHADALAIEVHHADAAEVNVMIAKKDWAAALLKEHCPTVVVKEWVWLASPPEGVILFTPNHPLARRLAEAGIRFPRRRIELP